MRIVYIVNGNGLSPELGGSVVRSANIAKRLAAMGHEVTLVTTSGGLVACRKLGLSVPSIVLRASIFAKREQGLSSRVLSYLVSSLHGVMTASSWPRADWVYTDSDYPCDVLPAIAYRRARGVRWVAMVHHLLRTDESSRTLGATFKRLLQKWMHKHIASHADLVFAYAGEAGDEVTAELVGLGADSRRVRRVNNGYDGCELRATAPAPELFDACLVGGIRPGKGLYEIVPIWRTVCNRRPARLALVGGILAAYRTALENEIDKAGLSGLIVLFGPRLHTDAISIVKSSTLMISPSVEEGWGIAVCESLACGVPVVGYDLPAYRSLFAHGMVRVPIGERIAFAERVSDLLDDPDARSDLAQQAPAAVAAYEWNTVAAHDLELMEAFLRR